MCKELLGITKILDPGNARLSLYSSVLQHELHSALVMKAILKKDDGSSKPVEEMKPLLLEAKTAVEDALEALKDETQETSGLKLYSVIKETKTCFEILCQEKKVVL
ncbi:Protein msta, isoform B [Operophtera brumata]|nr:Protein msta, isoform B [Operophtera brumata]